MIVDALASNAGNYDVSFPDHRLRAVSLFRGGQLRPRAIRFLRVLSFPYLPSK